MTVVNKADNQISCERVQVVCVSGKVNLKLEVKFNKKAANPRVLPDCETA